MPSRVKIRIQDVPECRRELDELVDHCTQNTLISWAMKVAQRVLPYATEEVGECCEVMEAFVILRQRQRGLVRAHDVRQAGFAVHALARTVQSDPACYALRCVGQAIGVGHMREHAMVCGDYAIKVLNSDPDKTIEDVKKERELQIRELKELAKQES